MRQLLSSIPLLLILGYFGYRLYQRVSGSIGLHPEGSGRSFIEVLDKKLLSFVKSATLLFAFFYGYHQVDSSIKIRDSAGPLILSSIGGLAAVIVTAIFGSFFMKTLPDDSNPPRRRLILVLYSLAIILLYGVALSRCATNPRLS